MAEENKSEKTEGNSSLPDQRHGGTILLVEDDDLIRKLTQRILTLNGYTVLSATGPEEAVRSAVEHGSIQLMITDVAMPRMDGRELAKYLELAHPEMKVLYMSGYTSGIISHNGLLEEGLAFIEKPFTSDELLRRVKLVLGERVAVGAGGGF